MPYTVDYFLYLTSNQVRYSIINDSCNTAACRKLISDIKGMRLKT